MASQGTREITAGLVVYGVLLMCALVSLIPAVMTGGLPEPSFQAQDILHDVRGGTVALSEYQGKPLVLCFFSISDPNSRRQIAHLKALRARYPGSKLGIIAACVEFPDIAVVTTFARKTNARFPLVVCARNVACRIAGVETLPTTVVFAGNNRLTRIFERLTGQQEIAREVERLFRKPFSP